MNEAYTDEEIFEFAYDSWMQNKTKFTPALNCFCNERYKELGWDLWGTKFGDQRQPVCNEFFKDIEQNYYIDIGLGILVNFINILFKDFSFSRVTKLRLHLVSHSNAMMFLITYFLTFFNSAVIVVLLNWNLSSSQFWILNNYLTSGHQDDWDSEIYTQLGPVIILNMIIQAVSPIFETLITVLVTKLEHWYDRGYSFDEKRTRQTSVFSFFNIYAGPQYTIQFEYANMMMATTVALIFGPCFPILYPICFVHLVVQYVMQRIVLFYWARQPPAIDEALTKICAQILRVQTFAILLVSFWQLGNLQIFHNVAPEPMKFMDDIKISRHTFLQSLHDVEFLSPNFLPFAVIFFVVGYYLVKMLWNALLFVCCCRSEEKDDKGTCENLRPFS